MTGKITDRYRDELCDRIAQQAIGYFNSKQQGRKIADIKAFTGLFIGLLDHSELMQPLSEALVDIGYAANSSDEAYKNAYAKCLEFIKENPIVLEKNP